jgi:hypothetical protein
MRQRSYVRGASALSEELSRVKSVSVRPKAGLVVTNVAIGHTPDFRYLRLTCRVSNRYCMVSNLSGDYS